ncbi:MAG: sigma 54-interacting transcriptional regulator [Planctomycetaceae bacterium]
MEDLSTSTGTVVEWGYLLGWDGKGWHDMVRLAPEQVTTLGRAPTNKIVLRDDICSRNHCEIYKTRDQWMLRDLGSRNGTSVDGSDVEGDWPLENGQIIEIGDTQLAFTNDPTQLPQLPNVPIESETASQAGTVAVQPAILARKDSPSLQSAGGAELAKLYKLGLQLGAAKSRQALAEVVLTTLVDETVAAIAAILLVPEGKETKPLSRDLHIAAYHSRDDQPYHRISQSLSDIIVRDRDAILARDVSENHELAVFDSLGELRAMSVICAPIQCGDRFHGLVHLYATNPDNPLDDNELNFAVAVADQMATAIDQLKDRESLEHGLAEAEAQKKNLFDQLEVASEIIGQSPAISELRHKIGLIAPTDATVLIRGESGVGKELVARSIHLHSNRGAGPMVFMNCAALNESLLESELFGHEKGAFTGATDRKAGRFEQADKGTLFLDEIGEMSPNIQAKFLRVLEGHPFERVGGSKPIQVDVRVVAATNRDLEEAVEEGEFRSDLYFRLNVTEIHVQPLRERRGDVALLSEFFLRKFVEKTGRPIRGFTDDAMKMMNSYSWPGNVRELQNSIERTVILCGNELVCASDIQLSRLNKKTEPLPPTPAGAAEWTPISIADLERDHILATLAHTDWNKSKASQLLGIERSTLDRKLKRYQVSRPTK